MSRRYCDDVGCSNFSPGDLDGDCKLGFKNNLRVPESMAEVAYHDWGYVMPKICRAKFHKQKVKGLEGVQKIKEARGVK